MPPSTEPPPLKIAVEMPRKTYGQTTFGPRPPAPALIDLAKSLRVTADELLGIRPPRTERVNADPEARREWKKFQMVAVLPASAGDRHAR